MSTLHAFERDGYRDVGTRTGWHVRRRARSLLDPPGAMVAFAALGGLIVYLLVREVIDPGYTEFLGYMIVQDTIAISFLLLLGWWLAPESQISRLTYTLVVAEVWADSLGNAVHLYGDLAWYDKVTHLGGGMAITAVAADLLFGLQRKRGFDWAYRTTILLAAAIAMAFCVGWEIYEMVGDRLIDSSRWKGWIDTIGDVIADSTGVLFVLAIKIGLDPNRFRADPFGRHIVRVEDRAGNVGGVHVNRAAVWRPARMSTAHVRNFVAGAHQRNRLRGIEGAWVRIGLWTGIIAPLAAVVLIGVAAVTTPNYDDFSNTISDLADQGQPHALLVRLNMGIFGVAVLGFGLAISSLLPRWHREFRALLVIFGLAIAGTAIFRDYGAGMPHNREGFIHNTCGVTAIVAVVIAMVATTSIGSRAPEWRAVIWPSIFGIFSISVSGLLFLWGPESLLGLVERLMYLSVGIWTLVAAFVALHTEAMTTGRRHLHRHRDGSGHRQSPA